MFTVEILFSKKFEFFFEICQKKLTLVTNEYGSDDVFNHQCIYAC
jgi:hypothetical protein